MPPVGSSKIIISFFPQKAIAIISFLLLPPERCFTLESSFLSNLKSSNNLLISSLKSSLSYFNE